MELENLGEENGAKHLKLTGRLDTKGVDEIEMKFTAACGVKTKNVLLDFSGVEFLSSMGIRLLVTAARGCARNGGKLVLYGPQELVLEAIKMASLDEMIPVVATRDEAVAILPA